jgi:hypothetical protein
LKNHKETHISLTRNRSKSAKYKLKRKIVKYKVDKILVAKGKKEGKKKGGMSMSSKRKNWNVS